MIGQVENRRKEVRCKYRELSFATTQFSLSSHPQVSQNQIPAPSDRHRLLSQEQSCARIMVELK
jgi:hypothetical protein